MLGISCEESELCKRLVLPKHHGQVSHSKGKAGIVKTRSLPRGKGNLFKGQVSSEVTETWWQCPTLQSFGTAPCPAWASRARGPLRKAAASSSLEARKWWRRQMPCSECSEGREEGPGGAWPPASLTLPARGSVLAQDSLVHRRKSQHLQWQEEVVEESITLKLERRGFKSCTQLITFKDAVRPLQACFIICMDRGK